MTPAIPTLTPVIEHWHKASEADQAAVLSTTAERVEKLIARRGEILDYRVEVAQKLTARDGYYYPDELPLGNELKAINAQIEALTA